MYSFKELRSASKKTEKECDMKIAVLGNCATQFLTTSLIGYARLEHMKVEVSEANYNQIDIQVFDCNSELYQSNPDCILLWLSTEVLYEEFLRLTIEQRKEFADETCKKIKSYWRAIEKKSTASILQMNFTEIDDKVLGQFSAKVVGTFIYQIRKLNWVLEEAMQNDDRVYPVDLLAIQIQLGKNIFFDPVYYYNAKMPVSIKALPYIAKAVCDILKSRMGKINKCVILDLDNTLWGGIVGDDGIHNIEVGELGKGHVFTNLQLWFKQLKECGILLAVCSKNDEDKAKQPFEELDEMVLRLEDFSIFLANWEDKVSNIRRIQQCLNIGMDSLVFIDDNPYERNMVRELLPEVTVPELPEDPAAYLTYLQESNLFDTVSFVPDGKDRTLQYRAEMKRKEFQEECTSIDNYLQQLEMSCLVNSFIEDNFSRVAQLTQRSNQFNLRTIRYSDDDIRRIANDDFFITRTYVLKDKYGDYGLVGILILERLNDEEVFIDTWIMSCRVLKRGMEQFIMNDLISTAKQIGVKKIRGEYIPTAKNGMVCNLYEEMGFDRVDKNLFSIEVDKYKKQNTFVKEWN